MKKIELKWYNDDERPTKSGYYLTISNSGCVQEIFYDPTLGEWNCYTEKDVEDSKEDGYSYNVIAWADPQLIHKEFDKE